MRRPLAIVLAIAAGACACACARQPSGEPGRDVHAPVPTTLAAFRAAVQQVLDDTGVPGAGIALVRQSGLEWAGGVGFADRDRKTPVT
ncbi:MAG: hypothetical protein ABI665_26125, partial [Vicinamibacterales bacterium]